MSRVTTPVRRACTESPNEDPFVTAIYSFYNHEGGLLEVSLLHPRHIKAPRQITSEITNLSNMLNRSMEIDTLSQNSRYGQ
jgi:hypothetical protein